MPGWPFRKKKQPEPDPWDAPVIDLSEPATFDSAPAQKTHGNPRRDTKAQAAYRNAVQPPPPPPPFSPDHRPIISPWQPPLTVEMTAKPGIEAFMGMVTLVHRDCSHWWCQGYAKRDLFLLIHFFAIDHRPGVTRAIQADLYFAEDAKFETSAMPVEQWYIFPMDDGNAHVIRGGGLTWTGIQWRMNTATTVQR